MTLGTLRDQVIYPDSIGEMKRKGWTDETLEGILDQVYLKYVIEREGGIDCSLSFRLSFQQGLISIS